MHKLTIKQRGFERSALVVRGQTTVAEVFTDREPGDQYQTAALFAAAPELLAALREAFNAFSHDDDGPVWADSTIAKARAAIAKATGADHA